MLFLINVKVTFLAIIAVIMLLLVANCEAYFHNLYFFLAGNKAPVAGHLFAAWYHTAFIEFSSQRIKYSKSDKAEIKYAKIIVSSFFEDIYIQHRRSKLSTDFSLRSFKCHAFLGKKTEVFFLLTSSRF